jgi:hypothetical protein
MTTKTGEDKNEYFFFWLAKRKNNRNNLQKAKFEAINGLV